MSRVAIEESVLVEDNGIAADLRRALVASGALALNFVGPSGSGKTMLLEKTLELLPAHTRAAVLTGNGRTGDARIANDGRRLMRYGYPVRQISCRGTGHLDAAMVESHLGMWLQQGLQLLLIENVGNLTCTAGRDLGEDAKILVLDVTQAEDEPIRHPDILRNAELMILNKIDLLPNGSFKPDLASSNARRINPDIEIIATSCITGAGLGQWMRWLEARAARKTTLSCVDAPRRP